MVEIPISSNDARQQSTATAGQTIFDYDFPIFDESHVKVYKTDGVTGATSLLVITTDYTVAGVGEETGGQITLTSGATDGDIYTRVRSLPVERITDFQIRGNFRARLINRELDLIAMMMQELSTSLARTPTLAIEAPALTSMDLPAPDATGKALLMSTAGFVLGPTATDIANAAAYAAQVAADKAAVELLYDTFDDRFLGVKASAPTLDNDGNALLDGAMYINNGDNLVYVYDTGTAAWYAASIGASAFIATLLDDADATTARTTLGLGDAATGTIGVDVLAPNGDGGSLSNLVAGKTAVTAATNDYVLITDTSGANAQRKATIQSIIDLAATGKVVDSAYAELTTLASTSVAIPFDDTKPTSSEGAQALTVSITPKSATNKLFVIVDISLFDVNANAYAISGLFLDAETTARRASAIFIAAAGQINNFHYSYEMTAGSTAAKTFKVRYGPSVGTMYLNGTSAARKLGGAAATSIKVLEIEP